MLRVTSGGGEASPLPYLLDLCDPQDYGTNVAASMAFARRGYPIGTNFSVGPVWDGATGWLAEAGARQRGMVWALASSAAATLKTRISSRWQLPIGADVASMVGGRGYWPLRYRTETILWRVTDPLIALAPVSFCVSWTGGNLRELSDSTFPGYELVSRSDVNGGNWTVRVRLANAGPLVVVQNTGVTPQGAGPQHLELRYDHGAIPRLSFFINGQEFGALTGLANVPLGTTSLQSVGLVQGLSVGGGVGQLDRQRQTRFRILELGGLPD